MLQLWQPRLRWRRSRRRLQRLQGVAVASGARALRPWRLLLLLLRRRLPPRRRLVHVRRRLDAVRAPGRLAAGLQ
jgi:hypothetical protein